MDEHRTTLPIAPQIDLEVTPTVRGAAKHYSPTEQPHACGLTGNHPIQRPDPAMIGHFIESLVPDYGPPLFGGRLIVSHNAHSFIVSLWSGPGSVSALFGAVLLVSFYQVTGPKGP